eukprot:TRINITY_DN72621_c0_g1_i1.p1 TRINITY_DN72621_c0_g1~~TRINITY_DN72621_c0_g1_i1.p1  ORF type:complete len:349 (-),score=70.24 TRINITY_DN72621_c0_g1_i1:42-1088(-)
MSSMLLHALPTTILALAIGAQAESIPHRTRMADSNAVAMEVEAHGMDDQHAAVAATSRIIRSGKQPTDVELADPMLPAGTACVDTANKKIGGTCHSSCGKTVNGHTYKREWCYTTAERTSPTEKWCFCTVGSDDETPEQVAAKLGHGAKDVASQTRKSATPVPVPTDEPQPSEAPQVSSGQQDDLVKQVKAMSAKLEGLQSVIDERLGKVDDRLKHIGRGAAVGHTSGEDENLNETNSSNSTNVSNETDTDENVKKSSSKGGLLVLLLLFACLPVCAVLMVKDNKAAARSDPAALPAEQQAANPPDPGAENESNLGDEQAPTDKTADPAASANAENSLGSKRPSLAAP